MLKTKYNKKNKQIKNKTKKRKNIKKTLRKKIKLVGGSQTPIQNLNYTYIATLGTTGSRGASNIHFNDPWGVAVSADNRIYVADAGNHRVQIFDGATRAYLATLGSTGSSGASNTEFNGPCGVAVSANGRLIYVADRYNHRVQVFDGTTRQYIATLGTTGSAGTSNAQFHYPSGVAVSADNRIYVADESNHRVQVFDGVTLNFIATLGTTGSAGASNTQFDGPSEVAVSADNRIYVADYSNHRVQIFKNNLLSYNNAIIQPPTYNTNPPPPEYDSNTTLPEYSVSRTH